MFSSLCVLQKMTFIEKFSTPGIITSMCVVYDATGMIEIRYCSKYKYLWKGKLFFTNSNPAMYKFCAVWSVI